jgi:hypothetical protein
MLAAGRELRRAMVWRSSAGHGSTPPRGWLACSLCEGIPLGAARHARVIDARKEGGERNQELGTNMWD